MALVPTDGNEVSDEAVKELETHIPKPDSGSEPSKETPVVEKAETPGTPAVPYHQDPAVQLYIERQVAKRVGEGSKGYEERIARLEERLTKHPAETTIGGWTPGNQSEAKVAKAIILQAKKEVLEGLQSIDTQERERIVEGDRQFSDFLGELRTTGTLKSDEDEIEFARLIAEYKLEDKQAAVNLWNRLQDAKAQAEADGRSAGEVEGIKRAQSAKVGTSRTGNEPGKGDRTYQQRRALEPNFDAILDREMAKIQGT